MVEAVSRSAPPISESDGLKPRIDLKISAEFVGIFIPVQTPKKPAYTMAARHFEEEFMARLVRKLCGLNYLIRQ
jgi:hypothetical protein